MSGGLVAPYPELYMVVRGRVQWRRELSAGVEESNARGMTSRGSALHLLAQGLESCTARFKFYFYHILDGDRCDFTRNGSRIVLFTRSFAAARRGRPKIVSCNVFLLQ